jgi:hypothetical protein
MQGTYHIKQFLSFVLKERFHPRADARGPQLKFDSSIYNHKNFRRKLSTPVMEVPYDVDIGMNIASIFYINGRYL